MSAHATGTFDVKLTPQTDHKIDPNFSRMLIEKQIHGDLEGTRKGEMLAASTSVKGSGAHVAIERITGKLRGLEGSFVLQHSGTMNNGELHLLITVVPDSGTGELVGITGQMTITIADGKHSYQFEYTLPAN